MNKIIAKLRAEAKKYGAVVSNDSGPNTWDINIDTPKGAIWNDTDCHNILCHCYKGDLNWLKDAVAYAIERMKLGVSVCTEKDCDFCNPEREIDG